MSRSTGEGGEKKKKGKELQDSENAGEDFIWLGNEEKRREDWEGRKSICIYFMYTYIYRRRDNREREKFRN